MSKYNGKKVGEIFETKDYSLFKFRADNRVINQNHVNKLTRKMKIKGWLSTSRVVINEKGELIDGQHRVKAAIIAQVPIRYTIQKGASGDDICDLNSLQRNWSPFDHLHKWVVKGNQHYIKLSDFVKDYPHFKITECTNFLTHGVTTVDRDQFTEGRWVSKDLKKAKEYADNITQLKPYFDKYYTRSIFVRAMMKIMTGKSKDFNFDEFIHKVKLRPNMLVPCGTVEQYVEMVENLYNYKRKNKVNLRF